MLDTAREATEAGASSVVLDGNFATPDQRQTAHTAARVVGAQLLVMHIDVNPTVGLARVTARMADPARASDADPTLHEQLRARFVPPTAAEGLRVVRVDGGDTAVRVAAEGVACLMLPVVG
jgi:predicted kinase